METENKKILSIIIPTYNAAKFLDKGLSSFIIDDNSPDKTAHVAIFCTRSFDARYFKKFTERCLQC